MFQNQNRYFVKSGLVYYGVSTYKLTAAVVDGLMQHMLYLKYQVCKRISNFPL